MCQAHKELDEDFRKAMDDEFNLGECWCGECCKSSRNKTSLFETASSGLAKLVMNPLTWYVAAVFDTALIFLLVYVLFVR